MKGTILDYSVENDLGYISGDDGKGYTFSSNDWTDTDSLPKKNLRVDFEIEGNKAINIFLLPETTFNLAKSDIYDDFVKLKDKIFTDVKNNEKIKNSWLTTVDISKDFYILLSELDWVLLFYSCWKFVSTHRWQVGISLFFLIGVINYDGSNNYDNSNVSEPKIGTDEFKLILCSASPSYEKRKQCEGEYNFKEDVEGIGDAELEREVELEIRKYCLTNPVGDDAEQCERYAFPTHF
jgi:hypothetical protein